MGYNTVFRTLEICHYGPVYDVSEEDPWQKSGAITFHEIESTRKIKSAAEIVCLVGKGLPIHFRHAFSILLDSYFKVSASL